MMCYMKFLIFDYDLVEYLLRINVMNLDYDNTNIACLYLIYDRLCGVMRRGQRVEPST